MLPTQLTERRLSASLKDADIVRAAEAIGLQDMRTNSIAAIIAEIRKRIDARVGARQRMGMIEVVVGDGE